MNEIQVKLRPITEADLPDYVVWFNDPEVTQFLSAVPGNVTLEGEREWLARVSAPDSLTKNWGIEADGRHIGNCALHIHPDKTVAGFGVAIGDKTAWNKGYGTAVLEEVMRIGFAEMNLHRIHLTVFPKNHRAIRCYEKCGFRYEGKERCSYLKDGEWRDVNRMAILRNEWEARQRGLAPEQVFDRREKVQEWQYCLDALAPQPGEIIVDAGCRAANSSLMIAPFVLPDGCVRGFDISHDDIQSAPQKIAEKGMEAVVTAEYGDIRALPLPDKSADAWFCRETLEYLDNPEVALAEAVRVVRPGGRVVAMEADWDTLAYNVANKDLERKFVAVHTDCGGGGSLDGRVGRKLLSLFREAGLADVQLEAHINWSDEYTPESCYVCYPLREGAVQRGCISQEELDAFYADLKAQAERERYFHCYSYFICRGSVK